MERSALTAAAIVIFIPDFIMLFAIREVIYSVTVIYFILLFTATFIIMKLVKKYGVLIFLYRYWQFCCFISKHSIHIQILFQNIFSICQICQFRKK